MISSKQGRAKDKTLREAKRVTLEAKGLIARQRNNPATPADRQRMIALQTELRVVGEALKVECSRINSQMRVQAQSTSAAAAYRNASAVMARAAAMRAV